MVKTTLVINGRDFSKILIDYKLRQIVEYDKIITTLDGTEHPFGRATRDEIEFSTYLLLDRFQDDYNALQEQPLTVEYDDNNLQRRKRQFRLDCNLEKAYQMHSPIYGNVYKGGTIRLRCLEVDR